MSDFLKLLLVNFVLYKRCDRRVTMKAERRILYLLAFYVQTLTAEIDPSSRVDTMNFIFSQPGWPALKNFEGFGIIVRWMEEAERCFTVDDLLKVGPDEHIVNYDNVECKIRQAHQFLSCQYANNAKLCYDYNIATVDKCKQINVLSDFLECVGKVLDMIGQIDEVVERMVGVLSCIYLLSPKPFDQDVSKALNGFKSYYNNLNYNRESLDKRYHDDIIDSTERNMATVIQHLAVFYNNHCKPISYAARNDGVSEATEFVWILNELYSTLESVDIIKGVVRANVDSILNEFNIISFGFNYDSYSKRTRLMSST